MMNYEHYHYVFEESSDEEDFFDSEKSLEYYKDKAAYITDASPHARPSS